MYERAGFRHERESEQWVRTATLTYGDARPGGKELEINRNSHRADPRSAQAASMAGSSG